MKANQAFRNDDEAVSPVIGVILMVAITVVLAAVVFVLVTNLSKDQSTKTPNVGFSQNSAAKSVSVSTADPGTKWADIRAVATCSDATATPAMTVNGIAVTDAAVANALTADPVETTAITATTSVAANDVVAVTCTDGDPSETISLSFTYKPTNTALGSTYTFTY